MNASIPKKITIDNESAGQRLDIYLVGHLTSITRSRIQKNIECGLITLNGKIAKKNVRLKAGDEIFLKQQEIDEENRNELIPQDIKIDIIFEDEYLMALNKPAGLVVHPGSGNRDGTMANALAFHVKSLSDGFADDRPGIVHRLDKETSGVMIAAKTNQAHAALATLFLERKITKQYTGICIGNRPSEQGEIEAPIGRSRSDPVKHVVRSGGRDAKTGYSLLKYDSGISVIQFRPLTGRTHQIRIHASYSGFPVLADPLYGGDKECIKKIDPLFRPFIYKVYKCFERHALHARKLSFIHPFTKERLDITAPYPDDMKRALDICEVFSS